MTTSLRFSFSATILSIVLFLFAPASLAQQYKVGSPDAYALAMDLRSGDTDRIYQAIQQFPNFEDVYEDNTALTDIDPLVVDGLISALDSQLDYFLSGDLDMDPEGFDESILLPLITYFTRFKHSDAIPVLLRATEIRSVAMLALMEYGPDIVPTVIDYMHAPERTVRQISMVSFVLTDIVSYWRPVDEETHATLRQLAIDYMQGYAPEHLTNDPQVHILKERGAALASLLGDADLKPMVEALADEFPPFIEIFLDRWYEGPPAAVQDDQIDQND